MNGLAELCANYCNEAMHLQFLQSTVAKNQHLYEKDGLEWQPIRFESNRATVDLIGQPFKGMLSILDEGICLILPKIFCPGVVLKHISSVIISRSD